MGLVCAAAAVGTGSPRAAGGAEPAGPTVEAVYVDTAPVVDGQLDDACWAKAARLEGFFAPDIDQAPPEETVGFICADEEAIYLGVICKDESPEDIKAAETRRNGEIWEDDFVEFALDPWHQHQDMYSFKVTPRGTQREDIPGGSATKIEWRGDWTAAAARTEEGWQAEMAIPFSILRYAPGQETFSFVLARRFAEERIFVVYPIMEGRAFNPDLAADLKGLHPPAIRPRPILMPYVTLDFGDFVGRRFDTGLDVQYRMPNGMTTLAALNPDFKQIEDAVEPISFSYTERYLPELRPFFVTGQGYLPGDMMLYTRRIEDFDAGIKLFGSVGDESLGLLNATAYGQESTTAAQWSHRFDSELESTLRMVSHRQAGDPANVVWGLNTRRRWTCPEGDDGLWLMLRQSQTQGERPGSVYGVGGNHFRGAGKPHWSWESRRATEGFDPALGYYYGQNSIGGSFEVGQFEYYETGRLESKFWDLGASYYPFLDGSGMRESRLSPAHGWSFRNGTFLVVGLNLAREYNQDSSDVHTFVAWNERDMYRRGSLGVTKGVRAGGGYGEYSLGQGFRPVRDLSVNISTAYSHLEPPSLEAYHGYQTVVTVSYDLTAEKCVSARIIARDAGTTVYAAYRQVVRRGMDAYVIVGDPDADRTGFARRAAFKLIWVM